MAPFKRILAGIVRKLDKVLGAVFALCGGLMLAQFPQYLAQYLQRLGGHADEARWAAKAFSLPILTERADSLAAGLRAMTDAPVLCRLPQFLAHARWDIAREALKNFTPGMTFNTEELYFLGAGALLALILYGGVKCLVRGAARLISRLSKKKPVPPPVTQSPWAI